MSNPNLNAIYGEDKSNLNLHLIGDDPEAANRFLDDLVTSTYMPHFSIKRSRNFSYANSEPDYHDRKCSISLIYSMTETESKTDLKLSITRDVNTKGFSCKTNYDHYNRCFILFIKDPSTANTWLFRTIGRKIEDIPPNRVYIHYKDEGKYNDITRQNQFDNAKAVIYQLAFNKIGSVRSHAIRVTILGPEEKKIGFFEKLKWSMLSYLPYYPNLNGTRRFHHYGDIVRNNVKYELCNAIFNRDINMYDVCVLPCCDAKDMDGEAGVTAQYKDYCYVAYQDGFVDYHSYKRDCHVVKSLLEFLNERLPCSRIVQPAVVKGEEGPSVPFTVPESIPKLTPTIDLPPKAKRVCDMMDVVEASPMFKIAKCDDKTQTIKRIGEVTNELQKMNIIDQTDNVFVYHQLFKKFDV